MDAGQIRSYVKRLIYKQAWRADVEYNYGSIDIFDLEPNYIFCDYQVCYIPFCKGLVSIDINTF